MHHIWFLSLLWASYGLTIVKASSSKQFSQQQCRLSLTSSLWLSAEFELFEETSPIDDYLPFAVYTMNPILGELDAFGVPDLVIEEEHGASGAMSDYTAYATYDDQNGFIKCSYKLDWYEREVDALEVGRIF